MKHVGIVLGLVAVLLVHTNALADNKSAALDEMSGYLEFVDYGGGTIFPEQIPKDEYAKMTIIDAREASQYHKEHIPGAINIEWRQVLAQRNQIPQNKPVLIYCNTGTLSAQAGFALRVAGWDNVKILQGGLSEWKAKGGLNAHDQATATPPKH